MKILQICTYSVNNYIIGKFFERVFSPRNPSHQQKSGTHGSAFCRFQLRFGYFAFYSFFCVVVFFNSGTVGNGFADTIAPADIERFETALFDYFDTEHPEIITTMETGEKMSDEFIAKLREILSSFLNVFTL